MLVRLVSVQQAKLSEDTEVKENGLEYLKRNIIFKLCLNLLYAAIPIAIEGTVVAVAGEAHRRSPQESKRQFDFYGHSEVLYIHGI